METLRRVPGPCRVRRAFRRARRRGESRGLARQALATLTQSCGSTCSAVREKVSSPVQCQSADDAAIIGGDALSEGRLPLGTTPFSKPLVPCLLLREFLLL